MKTWRRHLQCRPYTESPIRAQPSPARPPKPNPTKSAPNPAQLAHQSQTPPNPRPTQPSSPTKAKPHQIRAQPSPARPPKPNPTKSAPNTAQRAHQRGKKEPTFVILFVSPALRPFQGSCTLLLGQLQQAVEKFSRNLMQKCPLWGCRVLAESGRLWHPGLEAETNWSPENADGKIWRVENWFGTPPKLKKSDGFGQRGDEKPVESLPKLIWDAGRFTAFYR